MTAVDSNSNNFHPVNETFKPAIAILVSFNIPVIQEQIQSISTFPNFRQGIARGSMEIY